MEFSFGRACCLYVFVPACPCQHDLQVLVKLSERIFSPSMMMLLVSEVPEEAVRPHDSHGGEHKEVGLPPTQALLGQVHKLRSTVLNREVTVGF